MNSLQVDLIDVELERRGASPIKPKLLLKVLGAGLVVCIIAYLVMFIVRARSTERKMRDWTAQWTMLEPKLTKACAAQAERARNKAILAEICGWSNCRVDWPRQLAELRRIVPEDIQLTSLKVSDFMCVVEANTGRNAARNFAMVLDGRARGKEINSPKADVSTLEKRLMKDELFSKSVDKVKIEFFDPDSGPNVAEHWRVFEITVTYKTREFVEGPAEGQDTNEIAKGQKNTD